MFVVFDIENFYPSISFDLFNDAITFANEICPISDDELTIIMQARKSLLFNDKQPWIKKSGQEDFNVPMGYFDGVEVSEIVGIFSFK